MSPQGCWAGDWRNIAAAGAIQGGAHLGHVQLRLCDGQLVDAAGAVDLPQAALQLRKARPGCATCGVPLQVLLVQLAAPA